jgi:hypothetical protein
MSACAPSSCSPAPQTARCADNRDCTKLSGFIASRHSRCPFLSSAGRVRRRLTPWLRAVADWTLVSLFPFGSPLSCCLLRNPARRGLRPSLALLSSALFVLWGRQYTGPPGRGLAADASAGYHAEPGSHFLESRRWRKKKLADGHEARGRRPIEQRWRLTQRENSVRLSASCPILGGNQPPSSPSPMSYYTGSAESLLFLGTGFPLACSEAASSYRPSSTRATSNPGTGCRRGRRNAVGTNADRGTVLLYGAACAPKH